MLLFENLFARRLQILDHLLGRVAMFANARVNVVLHDREGVAAIFITLDCLVERNS